LSVAEFELGLLTDAGVNATHEPLPHSSTKQTLANIDELRAAVNQAAAGAQRLLSIYTPDLEPELYDQSPFLDIVKRFVLARNFAKVRVLLTDRSRVVGDSNRFVAMSRRLTSYIEMRLVPKPDALRVHSYLVADDRAIVFRLQPTAWAGVADLANPPAAKLQLTDFDQLWQANVPDYGYRVAQR
jgi:hypothetical protein